MTNPTLPGPRAALPTDLLVLAPVGGQRRAVKVVEHPAFTAARSRAAFDAPLTVLRLRVVRLNAPAADRRCGGSCLSAATEVA